MRPSPAVGLVALLAALTGCGSSTTDTRSVVQKQHDAVAAQFKMKDGDRTKPGAVPNPLTDVDGNAVDLAVYRERKKSVVLVVVKGLPKDNNPGHRFCPGCLAQLNSLAANYPEFKRRNAEVVLVFPGPRDALPGYLADAALDGPRPPFPVVSDSELKAVRALGIAGDWAKPSTYILNPDGNVVFAYSAPKESTYDRPSVGALLAQLDKINGTQ